METGLDDIMFPKSTRIGDKKLENNPQPDRIIDDMVVSLDFTLFVDGKEMDSSKETGPIQFIQGYGNIITGLEKELYGMAVGDKKHLKIEAIQAYGEFDREAIVDIPRSEFPADIPLTLGTEIEIENQEGEHYTAIISEVLEDKVVLDFNHPLAGKDLVFDVKVIDIRAATAEELDHGHAHDGTGH
jgi:FKBP-type peptidyl-prolyl cis-trans isomerase SlyD